MIFDLLKLIMAQNKIKENIQNKTEKLQDIVDKTVGLKYLIDRNQKNQQIKSEDHNQSFSFPFILLENKDNEQVFNSTLKNALFFLMFYF